MILSKVQNEAVDSLQSDFKIVRNRQLSEETDTHSLFNLMLGLLLRGSINEQDRAVVPRLSPRGYNVFMVRDGKMLFPSGEPPFPIEHIEACACETALFSHRYRSGNDLGSQATDIQTALVNPGEPEPLLFGWYGPETFMTGDAWDYRFGRMVEQLRKVYAAACEMKSRLTADLKSTEPRFIVDGEGHYVIWHNQAVAGLDSALSADISGWSFDRIRRHLRIGETGQSLTMRRVKSGSFEVSVVSLTDNEPPTPGNGEFTSRFLLHPAQQSVAGIIMAAEMISEGLKRSKKNSNYEMVEVIADEARGLLDLIYKQMLLVDVIHEDTPRSSLVTQAEQAVDRIKSSQPSGHKIEVHDLTECCDLSGPDEFFANLAETILRAHLELPVVGKRSCISFESDRDNRGVIICFETELTGRPAESSGLWIEYARRLAGRLNFQKFSHSVIGSDLIRTELRGNPVELMDIK